MIRCELPFVDSSREYFVSNTRRMKNFRRCFTTFPKSQLMRCEVFFSISASQNGVSMRLKKTCSRRSKKFAHRRSETHASAVCLILSSGLLRRRRASVVERNFDSYPNSSRKLLPYEYGSRKLKIFAPAIGSSPFFPQTRGPAAAARPR
ncbi:uncharacterized protein K444DRAFT_358644 [Hyaloscypha bicolor E]|uniref:Uncharacterized protein n=1 Tax=Hyaloscypha bicolor E TaxID=1095630 RepID=A0A2J6TFW2_9HELO|nr:uncharacterized protein K444DRAFT_358644 [Hyaloscypha bicolor E]PMD61916.1 hypothetical protein K444DRAFT_358644 [Hyaloscypha bicolor E]